MLSKLTLNKHICTVSLSIQMTPTPNIRGVDLDFETLEEKNRMAPNLRGVICNNLLLNLILYAYPQE